MALESPVSILYNSDGYELAVSGGIVPPVSTSAIMVAGLDSAGTARVLRTGTDGKLFITGSVETTLSSVTATQGTKGTIAESWFVRLTDGSAVIGTAINNALFVTGAVTIPNTVTTTMAKASTGTVSTVARSASSTTVLAGNSARIGASIYNDTNTNLFLRLASGVASTSSFSVKVGAQSYYEVPAHYSGIIVGIWASAGTGNAQVTEFTS
jgi:hypothetical protein